jgi:formate dehydrogenase alpha subunit
VLDFAYRGIETRVSTPFERGFKESGCVFCGNCLSVCPTGAMIENERMGKGREWELKRTETVCPYCGVGCNIVLHTKNNMVVRVTSPEDSPNEGWLCVKGRFGFDFVNSEERLKVPLTRKDGVLKEATWDEALEYVASRLNDIKKKHGSDAIGGFASAKCTNEENYLFEKFMRCAIGTNNVDHCARLCHAPTVVGLAKAFGSGAMTNTIKELEGADCIFVVGSNTTETQPVTALRIKKAKSNGAKLIVADPRKTELAEMADVWLRLRNGSDTALINGIMCAILRNGWENRDFIDQRTEGFEALREHLKSISMKEIERITGISMDEIERAAKLYANSGRSSIVYCMGITQHICGTDNVLALADLAMLCGQIGRESCGINPLRGQCNVQGACDFGALPEFFTGYQRTDDEKALERFERAWDTKLSREKGMTIEEMLHGAEEGSLKALYIMGENPVMSDPNSRRTIKDLEALDFLVVQDIFLTETAELADVVLPTACFAEKEGTFTNTERRVQRVRKAIEPPGIAKTDFDIICELSKKMGYPMSFDSPEKVMEEMASLTPSYGGISYERLEKEDLQWPCPSKEHHGTKYLHKDSFSRGKGRFYAVGYRAPAEMPDDEYPFLLSTGRVLYHFHTGTMSRKSRGINEVFPEAVVEINPEDADSLGLSEHETVRITSRRGSVNVKARITDRVPKGEIFMPFHFRKSAANVLTNDALDREAKTPEYKIAAVRIERMSETYNNLQGDNADAVT